MRAARCLHLSDAASAVLVYFCRLRGFPDALYERLQKAVQKCSVKRSALIREAVRQYLHRLARRKLARELAEGYRANAVLNRQISEEFIHIDADNL